MNQMKEYPRLTKMVTLIPFISQEKMDALTRRNKPKLKRCMSLGRYRMKNEKREEESEGDGGNDVVRTKFYELRRNGWMNGMLNGTVAKKGTLNMDGEINGIIEKYSAAVLSIGRVQLVF